MSNVFTSLKHAVHSTYVKTAEKILPTLSESKYLTEGVLTPEEVASIILLLLTFLVPTLWGLSDVEICHMDMVVPC